MQQKIILKEYYLLLTEGLTEFNIFAYLTRVRFRDIFANSSIQFSEKVEIVELDISKGILNGITNLKTFKNKYKSIRKKYKGQGKFFLLDSDIIDSSEIEIHIKENNDIVQFMDFNSEYLLLKIVGKKLRHKDEFQNLTDFRNYCKFEFSKHFEKKAHELKGTDFHKIFESISDKDVMGYFPVLFKLIGALK